MNALEKLLQDYKILGVSTGHTQVLTLINELIVKPEFEQMSSLEALQWLVENMKALNIIEVQKNV